MTQRIAGRGKDVSPNMLGVGYWGLRDHYSCADNICARHAVSGRMR